MSGCRNSQSCACTLCDRKAFIADIPSTITISSSSPSSSSSQCSSSPKSSSSDASEPCSSPKQSSSSSSSWESSPKIHSPAPKPKFKSASMPPAPPAAAPVYSTGSSSGGIGGGVQVYRTRTNIKMIRQGDLVDYQRVTQREMNGKKSVEVVNQRGNSVKDRKAAISDYARFREKNKANCDCACHDPRSK